MVRAEIAVDNAPRPRRDAAWVWEGITGGAAVAVLGLSLTVATGSLSLTPLGAQALAYGVVAAFVATTFGGICAALISREPGAITGPRTSISIVYAALCADLVARAGPNIQVGDIFAALSLAVVLMGVLQLLAGIFRLGDALKFLPYPVGAGFVTGIGLLIVWSQVGPLLGLEGRLANFSFADFVEAYKPLALLIGAVTAISVWVGPVFGKRIQPLLAALLIGTVLYHVIAAFTGQNAPGPTLGTIEPFAATEANFTSVWSRVTPSWVATTALQVLPYSVFLAIQGTLNAALTSVAVADIIGKRPNVNRTLIGQGAANVLSGALGALPIGSSPLQSVAAARMTNVASVVPVTSAIILLLAVAVFGPFLAYVPMAVLAGLLVTSGIGLIDRWARGLIARALKGEMQTDIVWNVVIVAAVAATFFFGSVPMALFVGAVLAMILLAVDLSSATTFLAQDGARFASTRVWPLAQTQWLAQARALAYVVRPRGGLFFGTADQLAETLSRLPSSARYCIVDFSQLTTVDATGCRIVSTSAKALAAKGVVMAVAGLNPGEPRAKTLAELGLSQPPTQNWFVDLDHALEWVELQLLREQGLDTSDDTPIPIAQTAIAESLSAQELERLQAETRTVKAEASAVLFKAGDPGSCMYIVAQGEVEIRTGEGVATGGRRLAAFGPASAFGEVGMLTGGIRTAEAVCTKPTVLYELGRDSVLALERELPTLYAKIMFNLNVNLATRLVVATEIVRGQR